MATTTTSKLQDLARRVAQQEAALAKLRGKLDARLAILNRRRETLRTDLRDVEAQIEAATPDRRTAETSPPIPATQSAPETTSPKQQTRSETSLAAFLIGLVREGKGKPVPIATLKAETVRRGFPTTSSNLKGIVETRASELARRGLLRRDPTSGGYLLPETKSGQEAIPTPASKSPAASKKSRKPAPQTRNGQPSLRSVLLGILKKVGRTLSAQELADQAKAAGYRSTSKDLRSVVWVTMRNMPEAEHDPKGGYRLKKGKG
jgi:hypothetical protein